MLILGQFAIMVIGASFGGVEALQKLAAGLPAGIPAALFVVQHIGNNPSQLPELLARVGPLPAVHAIQGQAVRPGRIYVAPPDHHLLLERGYTRLTRGPPKTGPGRRSTLCSARRPGPMIAP
jgi:two-component system chemotaxis response regulator CheB